jgi:hypothetical protein
LGDLGVDGRIILKLILRKNGIRRWNGFILLKIGSNGRLL